MYKDKKQFNSNVWQRSSWVVFRGYPHLVKNETINLALGDEEPENKYEFSYKPVASSNYKYSFFPDTEIPIIEALRAWSHDYFLKL
jgi:hypothetical protein